MSLWDAIIGQDWAVDSLRSAVRDGRFGHAYLITGPDHIGKTTLARTLAQAINCTAPNISERPCGHCRSCHLIALGRHPDVRFLSGEISTRGARTIKIDQIRQLQKDLNLTASEARYKLAILKQFENANPSAANAFLKTLEEPPQHVVLILTASDADTLLPTVASRCRIINLRPLSVGLITQALMNQFEVSPEEASLIAHISRGRIGWAIRAIQEPDLLLARAERLDSLQQSFGQNRVGRFALAESLARDPEELPFVLRSWMSWWRDAALLAHGDRMSEAITNIDQLANLENHVQEWPSPVIIHSLKQTDMALNQLRQNANVRLVLENLLLSYPRANEYQPSNSL